jgi:hypothetical protein
MGPIQGGLSYPQSFPQFLSRDVRVLIVSSRDVPVTVRNARFSLKNQWIASLDALAQAIFSCEQNLSAPR